MGTKTLKDEYLEKLSSKLQKLDLELEVFQTSADKTNGLAKAKYLEQVKNMQEKQKLLKGFIKQIIEGGGHVDKVEFRKKIDNLFKEMESGTREEKQRMIDLFK
jgi:hypothetical protein